MSLERRIVAHEHFLNCLSETMPDQARCGIDCVIVPECILASKNKSVKILSFPVAVQ
jgi:hypothetical protein